MLNSRIYFILLLLIYACQNGHSIKQLDVQEFNKQIHQDNIQIVDVRTEQEFALGHIENAINLDVESNEFDQASNILYKDLPTYIYYNRRGSGDASKRLASLGFNSVYELQGGYQEWLLNGLPVEMSHPERKYANDTIPFLEAIKGNKLVLVDFNATWCGPCKLLQPSIDRIHNKRTEDVIVYSIDVDENSDLALKYQASQIPLILLFKNDKIVHRSVGLMEESKLNQLIDQYK